MIAERRATFEKLVKDITARGLAANWYTIPAFTGYAPLTDGQPVDVDCAEVCLGPAVNKPGYDAYVVAQAFLSKYPSLILTTLTELRHEDRKPSPDRFTFDVEIDKKVSTIFLPITPLTGA